MSIIDMMTIKYVQRNDIFASAFRFATDGKVKILEDQLRELDGRQNVMRLDADKDIKRARDVVKLWVKEVDGKESARARLCIECQSKSHLAMSIRDMVYTGLDYDDQWHVLENWHQREDHFKGENRKYFLSGLLPEDRVLPLAILVIHFSPDPWEGLPISQLAECLDKELQPYVWNREFLLIDPAAIPDEDFKKFGSSLGIVLFFIKYSRDKEKLREILQTHEEFQYLGR